MPTLDRLLHRTDRLAGIGRALIDPDGRMDASPAVGPLFGREEAPGHVDDLEEALGAEQHVLLQTVLDRCRHDGSPIRLRLRVGGDRHVELRGEGAGDEVLCAFRDVSDDVRRSARLEELTSLLRAAERIGRLGHWHFHPGSGEIFWSDEVYRIHGRDPESGPPALDELMALYDPADAEVLGQHVGRALEHGESYALDLRIVREGQLVWIRAKGEPSRGPDGEVVALFGVIQEVQEAYEQQEHLARLSEVVQHTSEAIVLTDATGRIEWVNRGFELLTGYTTEEAIGHTPGYLLQGPGTDVETVARMRAKRKAGEPFAEDIRNYRKDGTPYWLHISCYPRRNADGDLVGFMAIELDVSAQREAHEALEAKRVELENLVFRQERQRTELERLVQQHEATVKELEREMARRQQLEDKLRAAAQSDELTGVANRRCFFQRAEREMARCERYGSTMAVVMLDIDHFKTINDTHGHAVGDRALQHVAEVCTGALREADLFARVGGEEFAMLLPHTARAEALVVVERLRAELARTPLLVDGVPVLLTCSLGVAERGPGERSLSGLLARADRALYRAKENGRNRWEAA